MTYINVLVRVVVNILLFVVVWMERKLRSIADFCFGFSDMVHELSGEMTPTWRETAKVVVLFLVLVIALAFLLTVGSD